MLSSSPRPDPPHFRLKRGNTSSPGPLQPRKRVDHARHDSEFTRPRPSMNSPAQTPTHRKTSSIYVNQASTELSVRNSVCSPVKSSKSLLSLPPSDSEPPDFIDHYAVLEVPFDATPEDIRSSWRSKRNHYFQTQPTKYLQLEASYLLLLDPELRKDYDLIFCAHALDQMAEESRLERKDSAQGSTRTSITTVQEEEADDVEADAAKQQQELEEATQRELQAEELRQRGMEEARRLDPNWGLKHHIRLHEPVLGTVLYPSYIPILLMYDGRDTHPVWKCSRPQYVCEMAKQALPDNYGRRFGES